MKDQKSKRKGETVSALMVARKRIKPELSLRDILIRKGKLGVKKPSMQLEVRELNFCLKYGEISEYFVCAYFCAYNQEKYFTLLRIAKNLGFEISQKNHTFTELICDDRILQIFFSDNYFCSKGGNNTKVVSYY